MSAPSPTSPDASDPEALGIASALIKARTEQGLTQAQLADASGVSRSAIKGYETGRNMPGSRELKALCRTLKITPNEMLFGTETPFSGSPLDADDARAFRALLVEPEDEMAARVRLTLLSGLLTVQERTSVFTLVQALAVARHGVEQVEKLIVGADLLAGMQRSFVTESARIMRDGGEVNPEGMADELANFMDRQGHVKKPE